MATVVVDGEPVEIPDGQRLNAIQVAQRAGIEIPYYCWHPGLSVVASCRMCLIEMGLRHPQTGEVSMVPKLVPACQTIVQEGMVIITRSEKVARSRAMVEEDLLIRHPIDCPICDKAGECYLQDYHFKYGQKHRRADIKPFTSRRRGLGDTVTLFVDRCVMCSRCVRFTREITGTSELMIVNRGSHEEIDVFPGSPLANKMSGNVVDLCPVGALGDKDFLYSQRVWFMQTHDGICTGCATGCSISIDENQDRIYRLRPRENPHVNQWWMCDEGRYGFRHVHSPRRIIAPRRRTEHDGNGAPTPATEWEELIPQIDTDLSGAGHLAAAISPHLTIEEAYLLCHYLRRLDSQAVLAVGPVPRVGRDERFRNGFTIRAEKCPNRRGVEELVGHFMGRIWSWDDLLHDVAGGDIGGMWLSGGYKTDWIDEATAAHFSAIKVLVVQALFTSPLSARATYELPAAAFAERDGSYVNHAGRLQSIPWAIRPPAGVLPEGRLLWRLLGRPGMYQAKAVLHEVAVKIPLFAAAAEGVPPHGLDLMVNQLAEVR